jgi:hypothetical protein
VGLIDDALVTVRKIHPQVFQTILAAAGIINPFCIDAYRFLEASAACHFLRNTSAVHLIPPDMISGIHYYCMGNFTKCDSGFSDEKFSKKSEFF